jgi:16S rRNA (cytosine1402-N4)-methyltransferase
MKTQTNTKISNYLLQYRDMKHFPVLLEAVLKYLDPGVEESYLDLTAGYGGHAAAVLERTLRPNKATLVDRDQNAIDYLRQKFASGEPTIIHQDFLGASKQLLKEGKQFNIILADLGVSSPHLDNASRGFSLKNDGPLDMRMDQRQSLTAEEIVNSYSEADLAGIFHLYGEEPKAKQIARSIVEHRPIKTTQQLAAIIAQAWPGYSKVHPATRVFQALRIAVNSELDQIKQAIPIWVELLAPGGRIAIISFHSLEDRLVKQAFVEMSGNRYDAVLQLLTKQPVTGSGDEIVFNPRARSAKLRAAVKIKKKG